MREDFGFMCELIVARNNLNRRRRRIYCKVWRRSNSSTEFGPMQWSTHEEDTYKLCQQDLKKVQKVISHIARKIGARISWGASWNIKSVVYNDIRYSMSDMQRIADDAEFERVILA